jgi:peptidyl-Lys metalloendopeptidase
LGVFTKSWHAAGTALAASLFVFGSTPALAETVSTFPVTVTAQKQYQLGEPIDVTFELHNPTGQDYSLLVWDTPLERWDREVGRYVKISHGNRDLAYQGRVVRRSGTPGARSYRTVHAGETVRETVDLSTAFAFTEPGTYTVTLDSRIRDAVPGAAPSGRASIQFTGHELDAAAATFELLPGGQPRPTITATLRQNDSKAALKAKFRHMSDSQERDVRNTIPKADRYVDKAIDVLHDDPRSDRYKKWFGKWNDHRYDQVSSIFRRIDHDADDATYDGACDDEDIYAYVRSDYPDHIWLCAGFWDLPLTGIDSKAGTIVHEESHFDVNGGTQDYAYGTENCMELARHDPNTAIANADNYAFFVETFD